MLAPPSSAGSQSFQSLVLSSGRVELISFPFTTLPVAQGVEHRPEQALVLQRRLGPVQLRVRQRRDSTSESQFIASLLKGVVSGTPTFENVEMAAVGTGLIFENTGNIWGPSRYSTLYVKPTTLQVTANGYTILTNTNSIQQVVSDFYTYYTNLVNQYAANGQYPMNGPIEIRVTGLDVASDVAVSGAQTPQLGPLRPRPDQPNWNCAVWLDALTIPGTPASAQFYAQLESWILSPTTPGRTQGSGSSGPRAGATPRRVPGRTPRCSGPPSPPCTRPGQAANDGWSAALATLDSYDPNRIFSNSFLDTLMP